MTRKRAARGPVSAQKQSVVSRSFSSSFESSFKHLELESSYKTMRNFTTGATQLSSAGVTVCRCVADHSFADEVRTVMNKQTK